MVEGTPVSLIEASAAGVPCVSTNVGGVAEVVIEGETGFLVDAGDAEGLGAAIARLAGDPPLRERMGRAASKHALERYSITRLIGDVSRLYEELLAWSSASDPVFRARLTDQRKAISESGEQDGGRDKEPGDLGWLDFASEQCVTDDFEGPGEGQDVATASSGAGDLRPGSETRARQGEPTLMKTPVRPAARLKMTTRAAKKTPTAANRTMEPARVPNAMAI